MIRSTHISRFRRAATVVLASLTLGGCGVHGVASVTVDPAGAAAAAPKPVSHTMQAASGAVQLALPIASPYSIPIGEFTAAEGADLLGCREGMFSGGSQTDGVVSATLTCDDGDRSGTFVLSFEPVPVAYTATPEIPEHFAGPWTIDSGTGDYELLSGAGTMVGAGVFPFLGIERWFTGTISYSAPAAVTSAVGSEGHPTAGTPPQTPRGRS
jgi:hypothetical protein